MADTREKLIELLTDSCNPAWKWFPNNAEMAALADHLIAHGVTVTDSHVGGKWISVKDRLPKCDQVVLCYKADRGVRIGKHMPATYADGVVAFKDLVRDYAFGATHWMPLPQPPKGE